jgi:geranylgeranyl pyrophosphate synthase
MAKISPEERSFLESMVQDRSFTPENKARVVELIGRYGTLDDLRTKAVKYADEARRFLEAIPPSIYKDALAELPGLILNRQS